MDPSGFFFFLPCRARHDSSDGRSRLHTIRTQLKRSHSWGSHKQKHKHKPTPKQKAQNKNTPKNGIVAVDLSKCCWWIHPSVITNRPLKRDEKGCVIRTLPNIRFTRSHTNLLHILNNQQLLLLPAILSCPKAMMRHNLWARVKATVALA